MDTLQQTKDARFEQVMREYGTRILRLVCFFVKDPSLAEDITQDVFVKVYRHLADFRGESAMHTWIYRIAVNECKGYLRSWSFRNLLLKPLADCTAERTVEAEVLANLEREGIVRQVMKLAPAYRQVIALHYYAELSTAEIAEILGTSEGAVRTKLHRARQQLKALMTREEGKEWMWNNRSAT
ncbi:sigma-70 family RNA polymerase sigma factor [Brevibacillus sp. SYP-B805]|uniref:sigma-70 family RNA polymerase sigma factor n=1 Tax=Brevibacillus sp. SYP-B805 TaxID=1578199 RepID=UPI0013EE1CD5|nr:sigma-70 family RNA polymerase sigma factor [Brevibacillus sp. SYP-B805]NGQ94149.1 sigma-70 family RNA polymerase sigma factor [Brevibacillus sp. SYP-B805]